MRVEGLGFRASWGSGIYRAEKGLTGFIVHSVLFGGGLEFVGFVAVLGSAGFVGSMGLRVCRAVRVYRMGLGYRFRAWGLGFRV